ncbi:hypothetical protein RD055328_12660 [Companilactobacillus sp. RD055328]|nr:hypothetical protein RD055328_12660 [Companilactobacillus sp. RD055328]
MKLFLQYLIAFILMSAILKVEWFKERYILLLIIFIVINYILHVLLRIDKFT